jgi:hypothetical protein
LTATELLLNENLNCLSHFDSIIPHNNSTKYELTEECIYGVNVNPSFTFINVTNNLNCTTTFLELPDHEFKKSVTEFRHDLHMPSSFILQRTLTTSAPCNANEALRTCKILGKQLFLCNNICCLQAINITANEARVTAHCISGNCASSFHSGLSHIQPRRKPIQSHTNAYQSFKIKAPRYYETSGYGK